MKKTGALILRVLERILGEQFYRGHRAAVEMELLYPGRDGQIHLREYYAEKYARMLLVFAGGLVLAVVLCICEYRETPAKELARGGYGSAEKSVELELEDEEGRRQQVEVTVSPRIYSDEEAEERLRQEAESLDTRILGENASLDRVYYPLRLVEEIEPGPIEVTWHSGNSEVMNSSGEIVREEIPEEGCSVYLQAVLKYGSKEEEYGRMITVYPAPADAQEQWMRNIRKALTTADLTGRTDSGMVLPGEVDGVTLTWYEAGTPYLPALIFLIPLLMAGVYFSEDQRLHERLQARNRQMEADYAEILNKLVLMLGAGMTVRGAWEHITADYRKYSGEQHFAYEEMQLCLNEMRQGVPELKAYEHFGRRCCSPMYLKLSALLVQNLKKGSKGLLEVFRRESAEALASRKHLAKQKGEEAGTKLLIPMFLLLGVVLVMVMVPAFRSMQI